MRTIFLVLFLVYPFMGSSQDKNKAKYFELIDYLVDNALGLLGKTEFEILSSEDSLATSMPVDKKVFKIDIVSPGVIDEEKLAWMTTGNFPVILYFGTNVEKTWAIRIIGEGVKL